MTLGGARPDKSPPARPETMMTNKENRSLFTPTLSNNFRIVAVWGPFTAGKIQLTEEFEFPANTVFANN